MYTCVWLLRFLSAQVKSPTQVGMVSALDVDTHADANSGGSHNTISTTERLLIL